jgi:hypothetical protein
MVGWKGNETQHRLMAALIASNPSMKVLYFDEKKFIITDLS